MSFILTLHSLVRWIIVLVALVALVKFAIGWFQKTKAQKNDRVLMSAFSGLIDLQVLLGFILLLGQGLTTPIGFPTNRIEHMITMLVAAVVAHLPMRWRNSEDTTVLRNNLIVVVAVIVLVILGVASLGGNRWF